eukprot:scaffold29687_cov71-Cyclotella_meneghiniana.AAC.3
MLNQFKPSKDSSCLNPNQASPTNKARSNGSEGTPTQKYNIDNFFNNRTLLSSERDTPATPSSNIQQIQVLDLHLNNCTKLLQQTVNDAGYGYVSPPQNRAGNGRNMNHSDTNCNFTKTPNDGGSDDMQWLEQALKNPQLASSAKVLLETTKYINTLTGLSGSGNINGSMMDNVGMPNMVHNQLQAQTPQVNLKPHNYSSTLKWLPIPSLDNQKQTCSHVSHSTASSSSQTSVQANLSDNVLNSVKFVDNTRAHGGNSFQQVQQQQLAQLNSFYQQQVHQAANIPQQYNSHGLNNVINNSSNVSYANQNNTADGQNINSTFGDDPNDFEPSNYRQEESEDLDLSFLLDDDDANDSNDVAPNSIQSNTFAAVKPVEHEAPGQSTPLGGSQPGSSQQMQEHLKEITKQHMIKFERSHANQQLQKSKKNANKQPENKDGTSDRQKTKEPCNLERLMMNPVRHQYVATVGGGMKRKRETLTTTTTTPSLRMPEMKSLYEYVSSMLSSRGYSLAKLPASEIGYITKPSPLQTASFGFAVCSSIKKGGAGRLSALLSSGLSPNPVNKFGDSPFFLACKRGIPDIIKTFLDHGTDVDVADGFGRTALHYVAWSNDPCFESAKLLLTADPRLICVMDSMGNTPLDFVGDSSRLRWLEFFESSKDKYWPPVQMGSSYAPLSKHASQLPDPPNALSTDLAEKVSSGHMLPEEARRLNAQRADAS